MRLTGPRNESPDDLRSAIAGRFGDHENPSSPGDSSEPSDEDSSDESSRAASDESSEESLSPFFSVPLSAAQPAAFAPEGDTLLPGGDALVEELREHVLALEGFELGATLCPPDSPPVAAEPPELPEMPEPPAAMRFGPTTGAAPPVPLDLPTPTRDSLDPFAELSDFATEPEPEVQPRRAAEPLPEPELDVEIRRSSRRTSPPRGDVVTIKKSSDKGGRKRFGKKAKDEAAAPEPAAQQPEPAASAPRSSSLSAEDVEGPRHTGTPLGELLLDRGIVSEEQLREALTTQTGSGKRLGNILVELGLLSERGLVEVLAEQLQVEPVELGNMELDREIVTLLSEDDARLLRAVPIERDGTRLEVAVADPLGEHLQDRLIEKLGVPVKLRFATATDIDAVINKMYASTADLGDALRMFEARLESRKSTKEGEQTTTTVVDENAPVVKVVNLILESRGGREPSPSRFYCRLVKRMMQRLQRRNAGFTMVELLIVIVILGILSAIVVYAVGNSTGNAATQACKTEARQFLNVYVAYQANHGGTPVTDVTTADKAATLATDHVLGSGTLTYLSPVAGQAGTVATATSPRWTFSTAPVAVVTGAC